VCGEWQRAHEASWLTRLFPVSVLLVLLLVVGVPLALHIRPFDLWPGALVVLAFGWFLARNGVYVGEAGVMVRVGLRRAIVPWHEIVHAEVAEVPKP
jgi:hypothetical protein